MAPSKPDVSAKPFFKECSALYNQKFEIVDDTPSHRELVAPNLSRDQYIAVCTDKFAVAQERLKTREPNLSLIWDVNNINTIAKNAKRVRTAHLVMIAPSNGNPRQPSKADSLAAGTDRNGFTIFFGMAAPKFERHLDYVIDHERGHFDDKHDILYRLYPDKFAEFDRLQNQATTAQNELKWKEEKLNLLWKALTDKMSADQKQNFDDHLRKIKSSFPPSSNPEKRLLAINVMIVFANELLRYGKEKSDPRLRDEMKTTGLSSKLLGRKSALKVQNGWDKDIVLVIALLKEAKLWEEYKKDHLGGAEPYLRADEPDVIAFAQLGIEAAAKYFPSAKKRK